MFECSLNLLSNKNAITLRAMAFIVGVGDGGYSLMSPTAT